MRGNIKLMVVALSLLSALGVGLGISTNAANIHTGRECDKFAIIKCGTMSADELRAEFDTQNVSPLNKETVKQADIQAIFAAFGIKKADLEGNFVKGIVYQDGTVQVNGKVVANNAKTAIRGYQGTAIPGSSDAVKVPTSKTAAAHEALVKLNDKGQFLFAVMTSCGNPVEADNTVPAPVYSCDALTATPAETKIGESVKFEAAATAKDATIKNYAFDFGDGNNQTVATNTITHTYDKAGEFKAKVTVTFSVNGADKTATSAKCEKTVKVSEKEKPVEPVYSCDLLEATPASLKLGETATFKATATAKDATIKNYAFDFGDGNNQTVATNTITHTYDKAGEFKAKVTVTFSVNGADKTATSAKCEKTVKVSEKDAPGVSIDKVVNGVEHIVVNANTPFIYTLKVTNTGNTDLKDVVVTDTPEEGAVLKSVADDKGEIKNNTWTYTIPELKKGDDMEFNLTAVVTTERSGKIANNACVDAPSVPGSPDDCDDATVETKVKACNTETGVIEKVEPGKEDIAPHTSDLSKCDKEEPEPPVTETPDELPPTGIADAIQAVLGLGALTTAGYYYIASRRS